ncbi:MAG TPA: hypothetical protein PKD00_01530 [Burkholderiales bacterium]|nr:hypothetical protein [Burkholderiales bacterium]
MTIIIKPLTEIYNALDNLEKVYTKDNIISFKELKNALKKIENLKSFDRNVEFSWSNTYHFYDKIKDTDDLRKILLLRYVNRVIRKLLTSFENLLIKIQSDGKNEDGLLPTFKQLNKILNIQFNSKISLAVFYEVLIEENNPQKYHTFGDINMIEVWKNVSNNVYDKRFLNWIVRYKSLLKNYINNETDDKIKERLKDSEYTNRKSFTYEKLVKIAEEVSNNFLN